jgi:trypsin
MARPAKWLGCVVALGGVLSCPAPRLCLADVDLGSRDVPLPRIRDGQPTFQFPAVGMMSAGGAICTATLIGCETVLTAAHCLCPDGFDQAYATCNAALYDPEDVILFFQHAGFRFARSIVIDRRFDFTRGGDVAIVKLSEPVTGIAPRALNDDRRPREGTEATIVGFGRTGESGFVPPGVGLKRIAFVETSGCPQSVRADAHVCNAVAAGAPAACPGDSGGPLLVDFGAGPLISGVQSGINGFGGSVCIPPFTGFSTDVFQHRSFIQDEAGADLGVRQCGDLPPVGSPDVGVHTFLGRLSAGNPELRGSFEVPAGTQLLRVTMNGVLATDRGRNNFDLFLKAGAPPTAVDFDCADTIPSALGVCEVSAPATATWHVLAEHLAGEGDLQITATLFIDPNAPPTSPVQTPTRTPLPPSPTQRPIPTNPVDDCVGDCDEDGTVTLAEIVRGLRIALGSGAVEACAAFDPDGDTVVLIGDLVNAVEASLRGCAQGSESILGADLGVGSAFVSLPDAKITSGDGRRGRYSTAVGEVLWRTFSASLRR